LKLKNKVAIITGAATGIGRATALLFAKEGAKTVLADVNVKEANETVNLVKNAGGETIFVETDVSKEADVKRMVEKTMEKYGRIDILVNNAGVVLVKPAEETTEQDVDRVISVNFKGVFFGCKHVIPIMKRQGGGVIVNIASVSGHIGQVNHAVYGGTKGGVIAMSRALAVELAPFKIRVNSISPGAVDTPMLRGDVKTEAARRGVSEEEIKREFEEQGLLKRWAKPEEIAQGILYLASDDSSYITGGDILIDGGWTAQ